MIIGMLQIDQLMVSDLDEPFKKRIYLLNRTQLLLSGDGGL